MWQAAKATGEWHTSKAGEVLIALNVGSGEIEMIQLGEAVQRETPDQEKVSLAARDDDRIEVDRVAVVGSVEETFVRRAAKETFVRRAVKDWLSGQYQFEKRADRSKDIDIAFFDPQMAAEPMIMEMTTQANPAADEGRSESHEQTIFELTPDEWMTAHLISLQAEAKSRSASLDDTLDYIKQRCNTMNEVT